MKSPDKFDTIIAGGGLIGLTAANALARINSGDPAKTSLKIALISPQFVEPDGRTTALLAHSIDYLKEIDVWKKALPKAAIMSAMRIIDNTKRLLHSPEVAFKSMEIGLDAFGYNILNSDLSAALSSSLKNYSNYHRINDKIARAVQRDGKVIVRLDSGVELSGRLLIGADGRNSTVRQYANNGEGIKVRKWSYPQTAIVLNFSHTLPHFDTSTEFHNTSGPFTVVPLKKGVSSLVWVVTPRAEEEIKRLQPELLDREIEDQMHSILGKTKVITDIQSFPLSGMNAYQMAQERFLLVGEAGHVFPPIGAQGYNLGIRDIQELQLLISSHLSNLADIAKKYDSNRKRDVISRTVSVDLFNRSLLSVFLPVQAFRSATILAISEIAPIRKLMMREGVSPGLGIRALGDGLRDFGRIFQNDQ
ncbi:MAG: UbiH/UbiF family hydroxylase [Hyphomicrobiales bacterium]|nr:UbiH/UbiF family hydroxylase [Hyphomicrobiales bacterium]